MVGHLDDLVTIKVFASDELPTQAALLKRDVDDLLHDLRSAGHGKIRVLSATPARTAAPARRPDARSRAGAVQRRRAVELQVKEGYLGLVVQYGGGHETIPFVGSTDDLEYRLASSIRSLTQTKKPVLDLLARTA